MKFSATTALLALAAAVTVSAHDDYEQDDYEHEDYSSSVSGNMTYTTEVVTAYTTYCPAATEVTHGTNTYTVTEPTTLTISDCPCTVSYPVYTSTVTSCTTCHTETPLYPISTTTPSANPTTVSPNKSSLAPPAPVTNGTLSSAIAPVQPPATSSKSAPYTPVVNGTAPPIATYTGAAANVKAKVSVMGGAAGLMGLVALMA